MSERFQTPPNHMHNINSFPRWLDGASVCVSFIESHSSPSSFSKSLPKDLPSGEHESLPAHTQFYHILSIPADSSLANLTPNLQHAVLLGWISAPSRACFSPYICSSCSLPSFIGLHTLLLPTSHSRASTTSKCKLPKLSP